MTTNSFTSAGSTVSISAGVPATIDSAGFGALTYTAIGEITSAGEFGKSFTLVTHNPLANRNTYKKKGSSNNGTMALQMARVPSDAGQVLLLAALASDNDYAFKVVLQNGTIEYFQGVVMKYTTNIGSVNQITAAAVDIEITGAIVEV